MLLELKEINAHYGNVAAVKSVSVNIGKGEIVTLLGSNGAGKSTTLRAISGLKKISSGEIWFEGHRIDELPPHKIVKKGIAHVPEGSQVFPYMTTFENLKIGAFLRENQEEIKNDYETVYSHFPVLKSRAKQWGNTLSGGEQQMLAIGRGLMAKPKLLLMDEPTLGLSPIMCKEIAKIISEIRRETDVSIFLIEQNARLALKLADRGYVMVTGSVTIEGPAQDLLENRDVQKAYLGM